MSKERELLKEALEWMQELNYVYADSRDSGDRLSLELIADMNKIVELLAQPITPRQGLEEYKKGYAQAEIALKPEPLSYDRLVQLYELRVINDPIVFARQVEKAHGIGVD